MGKPSSIVTSESPTDTIVKKAAERVTVKDSKGRSIAIKKLTPLDRMRMSKAAGADNATNQPYMLYALVACSVVSIDGEGSIVPTTERQLETAIEVLGEEGYEAALEAVIEMYGSAQSEEIVEAAKK